MKINIYNPTNQKPHVFSSWRVLFRVCACVHLSVHMKTIHGACAMERPMRSKAGGGVAVWCGPCTLGRHCPGWISALLWTRQDLGQFLNLMNLHFFFCKMDVTAVSAS